MAKTNAPETAKSEAIAWVLRLREPACTEADKANFTRWLAQNPLHPMLFEHYQTRWQGLGRFQGEDFPVRQAALSYRPPARKYAQTRRRLAIAAMVVLAFGVTAFAPNGWYGWTVAYQTAQGERQTVNLADGSTLELNSATAIRVKLNYWGRAVELRRGEAFFKVAHDASRPFTVTAANGKITDIGTQFDVYLKTGQVLVAVQEGSVEVDTKSKRILSANQTLAYNRAGEFLPGTAETVTNLTAWRQGQLVFDNRRLDDVLVELGRYHRTRLQLASPALAKLKVSGSFRTDRLDSSLAIIAETLPIIIQRPSADVVVLKMR